MGCTGKLEFRDEVPQPHFPGQTNRYIHIREFPIENSPDFGVDLMGDIDPFPKRGDISYQDKPLFGKDPPRTHLRHKSHKGRGCKGCPTPPFFEYPSGFKRFLWISSLHSHHKNCNFLPGEVHGQGPARIGQRNVFFYEAMKFVESHLPVAKDSRMDRRTA